MKRKKTNRIKIVKGNEKIETKLMKGNEINYTYTQTQTQTQT